MFRGDRGGIIFISGAIGSRLWAGKSEEMRMDRLGQVSNRAKQECIL